MKFFTKRMMLAAMLIALYAIKLSAQTSSYYVEPRFIVNAPSGLAGPKQFNWSQNPTNTTPWARPIDSIWYNVPVVKAYDTLGVNLLLNGTGGYPSLAGKFALILRGGNISFSQKADYCQRAGAIGVIIVNHKNGGTIGMAPTTPFSTNTTIPVIIISKEDGFPLNEALKAGQPVNVSLTSWGFKFNNDLGLVSYSPATPHAFCVPLAQVNAAAGTPRAYNMYTGAFVANFGTSTQSNVKMRQVLSFTPTGGATSVIYADSVSSPTFTALDSIQSFLSPRFTRQNFSSTGLLNMTYSVAATSTDQDPTDNVMNYPVYITDSIFCKSHWNTDRNAPLVSSSLRFSAAQPLIWGPLFYVTKGGYKPEKAQFAISADSDLLNNNITSPSARVYLFKWKDANADGLVNGSELSIVAFATKSTFANTDSSGKPFIVSLINANSNRIVARVEDNTWYMLAAELENDFGLGADNEANFYTRSYLSTHVDSSANSTTEYWAPDFSDHLSAPYNVAEDTLSNISFFSKSITQVDRVQFQSLTGLVPAMALHLSKQIPTAITTNENSVFKKFDIFPNPASSQININLDLDRQSNVVVSVLNSAAQSMVYLTKQAFSSGVISINTSAYPAGTYYLVVGDDRGTEMKPFTIVR